MLGGLSSASAYKQTYNVNIGETFTVYATYKSYTQSVLWTYDWKIVEPVGYIGSATTSVTFRAIAASPSAGSVIQAVTYYYRNGTTSSGINKSVDDWKVNVKDNSTVSLDKKSITLRTDGSDYLTATPSNSSYSGKYTWSSSNSNAAYISGSGSSVRIIANSSGNTTITVKLDNGNSAQCGVTVRPIDVTSASVSPSSKYLDIDESEPLSLSVLPSNAAVTSRSWKSKNSGIASVSSQGMVTGVSEGRTEIYCVVNGTVTSSSCIVNVSKPPFTITSSSPTDNATSQSVFIQPSLTFCRQIYQGNAFSNIALKDENGKNISGNATISGAKLLFAPSEPLEANTQYTLIVPAQAVRDKYGSSNSIYNKTFTTGNLQKLSLSVSTTKRFLSKGEMITLASSGTRVSIYYTLDGTIPTEESCLYQSAIVVNTDIQLRAIAMGAGYESSNILSQDYYITNVDIAKRFPESDTKMFEYRDVNPYIKFSNGIVASSMINEVKLQKGGKEIVDCNTIVADSTIFIVPVKRLDIENIYTVSIPADAIKTWQGESCKSTSWSFSTGNYATAVSTGGPELAAAIKTDGSLWTWGKRITDANAVNGSYSYTVHEGPAKFVAEDVVAVSSGYMHHALIKRDGSLWMWGRQYCGEFGNSSTTASAQPVKVMDGVKSVSCGLQTTAIVKDDGTLWMCGRNDMGQIDESYTVKPQYVMVAEGIKKATLGWGGLMWEREDGTIETRTWDETADSKRQPSPALIEDIVEVSYGWKNAIALKQNGSVWQWGLEFTDDLHNMINPKEVVEGRVSSTLTGISSRKSTYIIKRGAMNVIDIQPVPLNADYSELTWNCSDENVVSVSDRGVIKAEAIGETDIVVTIKNDKGALYSIICHVIVEDEDTDTKIELEQGWNWISHNQQEALDAEALKPNAQRIVSQTDELYNDILLGWTGDLDKLLPTEMYKVQMAEADEVQLTGKLFNATLRAVPLYEGWNWLGYPVANTMTPAEALQKLEAEEGDFLIGQDGMVTYSEGHWTGTLTEMVPGLGYMYRSGSDKNLFYNATAQASSRRVQSSQSTVHSSEMPEGWTVNKRKYPNVMGVIAQLWHEDNMANSDEWLLGAFCGDECRGIAKAVDGALMMNVYGQGGEQIEFHAMNYETGELLIAVEQEPFRADVVGTMNSPYQMHIGEATGIAGNNAGSTSDSRYYDLQGRKVENGQMRKGLYIVTGSNRNKTQKVVKK